jgi:uncharacterized membrane protein YdcZ (DUF606 family)
MLQTPIIVTKEIDGVPKIAVGILVGVLLFGMFIVGMTKDIYSVWSKDRKHSI